MPDPLIAIIVPCYNDGRFLPEALASVAACDPSLYELIIVNDGSTDPATLTCLRELEERDYRILHQENKGLAAARNAGIAATRAPCILPLDSDNRIRPHFLEVAVSVFGSHDGISVVYGDLEYFGARTGRHRVPKPDFPHLLRSNYIDACAAFRRTLWQELGGYDESMRAGLEDWDFWLRAMAAHRDGFHHEEQILFDYRVRDDSMIGTFRENALKQEVFAYIRSKSVPVTIRELIELTDHWHWLAGEFRKHPQRLLLALRLWLGQVLRRP